MTPTRTTALLLLTLVLGLLLRLPGWFTADAKTYGGGFEPDEGQHVQIAAIRFNELVGEQLVDENNTTPFNVRGYGHLMAYVAYGWYGISGQVPNYAGMLLLGRQLATVLAVLLILIIFHLGRAGGLSPPYALTAALLMAGCDVNATYAHYALPASGYVFTCYLAVLGGLRLVRRPNRLGALLLGTGAGGALALKFDFLPLVWGGLLLLALLVRRERRVTTGQFLLGCAALVATTGSLLYGWGWADIRYAVDVLRSVNVDDIATDDHWRDNLIVYPFGVLAGIGLPAFALAVVGTGQLFRYRLWWGSDRTYFLLFAGAWLLSEFYVRWSTDTAFIRRVNVFMPAVTLLAAYALQHWRTGWRWRAALVTYTFLFAVVGQSNHWFDTRTAALAYVREELNADDRIRISPYMKTANWPDHRRLEGDAFDLLLIHETYYSRYFRSMTTPFGLPACNDGVYHPASQTLCRTYQALLTGTHPTAERIAAFRTRQIFPERLLYKRLFGNYETFLGDVLVFRNTPTSD